MCVCAAKWAGVDKIVFLARKTKEMVNKGYYKSSVNIQQISEKCASDIKLEYLSGFEKQILDLINEWEKR